MGKNNRLDTLTLEDLDKEILDEEKKDESSNGNFASNNTQVNRSASGSFQVLNIIGYVSNANNPIMFTEMLWYGKKCYDLRHWNHNMGKPLKGLTFSKTELLDIRKLGYIEDVSNDVFEEIGRYQIKNQKAVIHKVMMTYSRFTSKGKVFHKGIYLVNWGQGARIDIRGWADDYSACTKGITLSLEEYNKFINLISI